MSKKSNEDYENDGFVIDWKTGTVTGLPVSDEIVEETEVICDEETIPAGETDVIPEEGNASSDVAEEEAVREDAFGGDITDDALMQLDSGGDDSDDDSDDDLDDDVNDDLDDETAEQVRKEKKKKKRLIIILIILAVLVVGITGSLIYALSFIKTKASKVTQIDIVRTDLDINSRVAKELKNYRNIALLGIDTRNIKNNKGSRSDAIIIASINKKNNNVKLASVYRDSYLNIKIENQFDKVTHAFAYGGASETVKTLNRNLDLNIEEVFIVNWGSVADVVDALGGLEIDVKANEIDELNKYIVDTLGTVKKKTHYIKKTGLQTLDGIQAVTYARIRKGTSGGDVARAQRMRKLVNAAFKKIKKMNIAELNTLIDKTLPEIITNMSDSDIMSMALNVTSYKVKDSIGWPYKYSGELINGIWYDVPVTLQNNVVKLHKDLFNQDNYNPTDIVKEYNQQIISETGTGY